MELTTLLPKWQCAHSRVVVRADLNVPLDDGIISSDVRLRAIQPTLDEIIKKDATIILLTHLGRPKKPDPSLSTKLLIPWFEKNNYSIVFAPTIPDAHKASIEHPGSIILLENLRFFPGEKGRSLEFAQQLAQLGEYFVQDAFGALHDDDASIALLPEQFPPTHRTIGFLVEREIKELNQLTMNIAHPFCIIIGGNKPSEKIPLLEYMATRADSILLCPALVFSFLKAMNKPVGKSAVDTSALDACKKMAQNSNLIFPKDYQVAQGDENGQLSFVETLSPNDFGISIGPKTIDFFCQIIKKSRTIFFNGAIGFANRPETVTGMKALFQAMTESKGISIVAGGDSAAAIEKNNIKGITYISTGGGAALAYLSGQDLPGLQPFINK